MENSLKKIQANMRSYAERKNRLRFARENEEKDQYIVVFLKNKEKTAREAILS